MNISPVSFGSLMCFTLNDGKPKAPVPVFLKTAFKNNPSLKKYNLQVDEYKGEPIDGTVYNAASDFCFKLDDMYKGRLPKGCKNVILTQADFYVAPNKTEKRFFLTAATYTDEDKIQKVLSKGNTLYVSKFNGGKLF